MKKMKSRKGLLALFLAVCMIVTSITITPKQAEAAGSYWIKVNRKMNTVTVYQYSGGKYKAVKAMVCSVGKNGATPRGNYNTQQKLRWHILMGNVWGQYCTRIHAGYLFHSVWYYSKNKSAQSTKQYNKLGKAASHGCVRLTVADSKWIYDKCPIGTKVTIYDSSNAGPLGKPKAMKVSTAKKMGWDPTDPDPNNPYSKNKPTIKFSSKKAKRVALYSSEYNAKSGVSAKSHTGKNLTSKIKVSGKVNTKKPGTYTLTYTVKDSNGYTASATFKVTVVKPSKPVFVGVKSSVTLKLGNSSVYQYMKKGVRAIDRDGSNITSRMKLTCSDASVFIAANGKTIFKKPGTYKLTYSVTGTSKNGSKKATKVTTVRVVDDSTPSITQTAETQTVNLRTTYGDAQIRSGVTASTVKGTNLTSKITYTVDNKKAEKVDTTKAGTHTIKYTVTSSTGRTAYAVRTVTVADLSVIQILGTEGELTIPASASKEDQDQRIRYGVKCLSQYGTDYTKELSYEIVTAGGEKVDMDKISKLPAGEYIIYYTCKNPVSGETVSNDRKLQVTNN